ncbi:hypothetical protein DUNSADRAFT_16495 [Dunaliella salina]|uniref:Uncharacterized protein n=1 Tax=Dunaliella salina TaxID=3046 RepID=A0ABQ7G3H7_DUNSA|nr:hypothetical protein DUNSADRAFT_16495 [Dunaliella salina]|eukprot:KAF5829153.1 hypothetical protein DUNSADRAFT_16495 [Dunaliella salina]
MSDEEKEEGQDDAAAQAAMLDQLANLKLTNGEVQEAQRLFRELASLRANQIKQEAARAQAAGSCGEKAAAGQPEQQPSAESAVDGQQHEGRQHQQQQQQQQQQQGSGGVDSDNEWETKDWDHALESIRPPVPSAPSANKPYRPPALQKARTPTAAEVLASQSGVSRDENCGSKDREANGKEPEAAPHLEELDPREVVTDWSGGFDHCVELGGLTTDVRTGDIQELLDTLLPEDFVRPYIRWADDNHAVLVCANVTAANTLLEIAAREGMVMRPFLEATQVSKQLPISELLPPKDRPKTSTTVARRLMSHALGLPGMRDRKGERELAEARKQAKEERRAKLQAAEESKASAWGDC